MQSFPAPAMAMVETMQAAASNTALGTVILAALTLVAAVMIFRTSRNASLGLAAAFLVMIVPVAAMGYQITAPFLVLGAVAIAASAFVGMIFERARSLQTNG